MARLGVLIVGVGGAVASTVVAGVELMKRNIVPRRGMITESGPGMPPGPLANQLDVASLDDLVFGGWDINPQSLFAGALQHNVLPPHQVALAREALEQIVPWPGIFKNEYSTNLRGDHVVKSANFRDQIKSVISDIEAFKAKHRLDRVVMVNLASTESWIAETAVHKNLATFEAGLDANDPAISPSARYFYAANRAHAAYINFSPGPTSPALTEHAEQTGNPFAGSDGKTGQTLVKTVLGAMFRVRQLKILGWYSINFLGNNDGLCLDAPGSNKTKVLSKSTALDAVVGYPVENHQVHIHYYKPRGDAKEAWDNIDVEGFAGIPMQMKVNFLCQDSVLAAPLVVDLVRLLDVCSRAGGRGNQRQFSLFFKSPYAAPGETPVHDLFDQEKLLLDWAAQVRSR